VSEAVFIAIEVEDSVGRDHEVAAKLAEVCPVDIFTNADGHVEIVEENLDECVLCELCINAAPEGAVKVIKLYSGESLPA
jgi:NAD-dependent dihydropyrimidine dehydrogenase PreA subunit